MHVRWPSIWVYCCLAAQLAVPWSRHSSILAPDATPSTNMHHVCAVKRPYSHSMFTMLLEAWVGNRSMVGSRLCLPREICWSCRCRTKTKMMMPAAYSACHRRYLPPRPNLGSDVRTARHPWTAHVSAPASLGPGEYDLSKMAQQGATLVAGPNPRRRLTSTRSLRPGACKGYSSKR